MSDWRSVAEPESLEGVLRTSGGMPVPWAAAWTGEDHGYVARPDPLFVQRGFTGPCLFEAEGQAARIDGRRGVERLIGRNRRLRALLIDVLRYLERPGPPERELERRCDLAGRIREAIAE